jgi:hypothetical protein
VKNFTLGQDLGNDLTNPISWSFYGAWPKELNLTFTVWNNSTNPPGKIVSFHYSKSSAFSGNLSSVITTADTYFNKLFHFAWQVTCADNFYGDDCSTHCIPMDGMGGHYNCSSNGIKTCLLGWKDPYSNCTTSKYCMLCVSLLAVSIEHASEPLDHQEQEFNPQIAILVCISNMDF